MSLRAQRSNLTRRLDCFVAAALLLATTSFHSSAYAEEWNEVRGDHFIVYYAEDAARPKEVIRKAELYYNKIAEGLGYARHSNFWQWDKRVKIYIHPTREAFRRSTGQPAWSHGMASYLDKSIHSIQNNDNFLDEILPHEIAHLIFRDFVGFKGQIPLWMDEGVAQWQEDNKRAEALLVMPQLAMSANMFRLQTLMTLDIRRETDPEKVAIFYTQAISLIDYLVRGFGPASFTDFCRALRDGKSIEEALRSAYAGKIGSVDELEERWLDHLHGSRALGTAVDKALTS
jgi:hypothetical protein